MLNDLLEQLWDGLEEVAGHVEASPTDLNRCEDALENILRDKMTDVNFKAIFHLSIYLSIYEQYISEQVKSHMKE